MYITHYWIHGFMIGFEYVPDYDEESHLAIDFGILRLVFSIPHKEDIEFD
jgi:hypothetical protein